MIIVKLIGGLGNQLFQYAAARRISYLHHIPLKLDISEFERYKLHNYSLMHFNIIEEIATQDEIEKFKPQHVFSKLAFKLLNRFNALNIFNQFYIMEHHFHFDPNLLKINRDAYLDGYWQSEKYFLDIEPVIRKELSIKIPPDRENELLINKIANSDAVSLHIRRADYVANSHTNTIHGTCSPDYYHYAVDKVAEKVKSPHFFIFSDDPAWTLKNLKLKYPATFVTKNGPDKNYEDLRLMSLCRHNIIANSTFSWWGAWLNPNPYKTVIAPKKWFNTEKFDAKDVLPESWTKL